MTKDMLTETEKSILRFCKVAETTSKDFDDLDEFFACWCDLSSEMWKKIEKKAERVMEDGTSTLLIIDNDDIESAMTEVARVFLGILAMSKENPV